MKTIYHLLLSILLLGITGFTVCDKMQAQNPVTYGYDASGNRMSRVIVFTSKAQAPLPKAEATAEEEPAEEKVYTEMLKNFSVRIYPNPTKGDLTVEIQQLPDGQTANLKLYNMSGKLIHHKNNFHGGIEKFNISKHPAGIYVLKIVAGDSSTEWKIVKK